MSTTPERARDGASLNRAVCLALFLVGAAMAAAIAGLVGAVLHAEAVEIVKWTGATFVGVLAAEMSAYRFLTYTPSR